jgi:hypothetical protein
MQTQDIGLPYFFFKLNKASGKEQQEIQLCGVMGVGQRLEKAVKKDTTSRST